MIKSSKRIIAAFLSAILLCALALPAKAENVVASSMKLLKTEGTVAVIDKNEKSVSLFKGMKLQNGYEVATSTSSYAWINLDDTKMIKLDALTNVGVSKEGKDLTLTLNSGKILVDVSKKLDSDESLHIKTGNVITGVRGTLFTVAANDPYFENANSVEIVVYEGRVAATMISNGKSKEISIDNGNKAKCSYNLSNGTMSSSISKTLKSDVYGFAAVELALDQTMRNRAITGSPELSLPDLGASVQRLGMDIIEQDNYITNLANLRNENRDAAIYYKVGIKMQYYGQTADGQYISGMNPNTGEAQYVWNPIDSSGGVYRPGESYNTNRSDGYSAPTDPKNPSEDGPSDPSSSPENQVPTRSSSSKGEEDGGRGDFD